jgi:hypothetical protein
VGLTAWTRRSPHPFRKGRTKLDKVVTLVNDWVTDGEASARSYLANDVRQGFVPEGRGVCRGQQPVVVGATEIVDHDLILWLIKDLTE